MQLFKVIYKKRLCYTVKGKRFLSLYFQVSPRLARSEADGFPFLCPRDGDAPPEPAGGDTNHVQWLLWLGDSYLIFTHWLPAPYHSCLNGWYHLTLSCFIVLLALSSISTAPLMYLCPLFLVRCPHHHHSLTCKFLRADNFGLCKVQAFLPNVQKHNVE